MANKTLDGVKFSLAKGTAAAWTASTRVLLKGELGVELDTGRLKVGDGTKTFAQLSYITGEYAEKLGDASASYTYAQLVAILATKLNASEIAAWAKAANRPSYKYGDSDLTGFGSAAAKTAGAAAGNVPVLDANGKLATSVIPPLAISETFVVASQAAMLALTAQRGDIAIRTDESKTYILTVDGGSGTLENWKQILTPDCDVTSVNGKTGAVTLGAADVGADPTGAAATVQANLNTHDNNTTKHITSTERTTWDGKAAVGSTVPSPLAATASAGASSEASRADHKHKMPSATDVGAVPTSRKVAGKALSSDIAIAVSDLSDGSTAITTADTLILDGGTV